MSPEKKLEIQIDEIEEKIRNRKQLDLERDITMLSFDEVFRLRAIHRLKTAGTAVPEEIVEYEAILEKGRQLWNHRND